MIMERKFAEAAEFVQWRRDVVRRCEKAYDRQRAAHERRQMWLIFWAAIAAAEFLCLCGARGWI